MFSIHIIQGFDQGERLEIANKIFRFGRDSNNDLQIHDSEVSRFHAELQPDGDGFNVVDLESSNGTFVNGQRTSSARLSSGDRIQMGNTHIVIRELGGGDATQYSPEVQFDDNAAFDSQILESVVPQFGGGVLPSADSLLTNSDGEQPKVEAEALRSHLQVMYQTTLAVSQTLDIDELLERVLSLVFDWVDADRACILLIDQRTGELSPRLRRDRDAVPESDQLVISRRILEYVIDNGEGVVSTNASRDERWEASDSIVGNRVNEAICVPLTGRYGVVGVIYIDTAVPDQGALLGKHVRIFTNEHLRMLVAIGHQTALAVEDTYYYGAMLQSEKLAAMGQTVTSIAHHIKNILQGIRGGGFVVEDGLQQNDCMAIAQGWDIVKRNQDRISGLVMDMLSYSKDRQPERERVSLQEIANEVVEMLTPRAAEKDVMLEIDTSTDLDDVLIDALGIHRVVWNVVSNAIDACTDVDDATVQVYLEQGEAAQFINVVDRGKGIATDEIEKIFAPFVSDKGGQGTGLGLAVSRKVMREHGGDLTVSSVIGEGSTFKLFVPVGHSSIEASKADSDLEQDMLETGVFPRK
ncbi:MAG: FHA domain-containing protein [Planctomycetaceae bacterium]|jgi:two-component system, NtrC family, sensor kinase|nr:FHA domain-containing protein [Planctomycetaceae bacterium]